MSRSRIRIVLAAYVAALLIIAAIRASAGTASPLAVLGPWATPLYVAAVIVFAQALARAGVEFDSFGFGRRLELRHLMLAVAGYIALYVFGTLLGPVWAWLFEDMGRELSRFASLEGDLPALLRMLLFSWAFAAFGEELAYRIVLQRSLYAALGEGRGAAVGAILGQALVFGAAHAYQGPVGVAETVVSGVVYGLVASAGRFAIWPSALLHGFRNTLGLVRLYLGAG
ncbi:MAG: CPBP family intramembrane glutamic endopeptidase [Myxococcota bacterium]